MHRSVFVSASLSLNLLCLGIALMGWVAPNVPTTFNPHVVEPIIARTAHIHPLAAVIGSVTIGELIVVAPGASVRGDEGQHIFVGDKSNVQDGVIIHGLETFEGGHELPENEVQGGPAKTDQSLGLEQELPRAEHHRDPRGACRLHSHHTHLGAVSASWATWPPIDFSRMFC